jgi:hypothetical protein
MAHMHTRVRVTRDDDADVFNRVTRTRVCMCGMCSRAFQTCSPVLTVLARAPPHTIHRSHPPHPPPSAHQAACGASTRGSTKIFQSCATTP